MARSKAVAAVVEAAHKLDTRFIRSELVKAGVTYKAITAAVEAGVIRELNTVRHTGKRGKPAAELELTAKGRKTN